MKSDIYLVAFYPELWNESEIDNDIKRCRQIGINKLRIGEFACKSLRIQATNATFPSLYYTWRVVLARGQNIPRYRRSKKSVDDSAKSLRGVILS